jgi:uncharacterized protein YdiU (UPF0061 family)
MGIGFIHGVMNTDNTTLSGETIDYGPCAFMDTYDPGTVFSSIDRHGRYAYGAQPAIIAWNMSRLAQALLPLIDDDGERAVALAQELLDGFPDLVEEAWLEVMGAKIGIDKVRADDRPLIMGLLDAMHRGKADFTNTFRALASAADPAACQAGARAKFEDPKLFDQWAQGWLERLQEEDGARRMERMRQVNPVYVPRNHLVEAALEAAIASDDYRPLEELMKVLSAPYQEQPDADDFRRPPGAAFELSYQTYCGT